MNGVIGTVENFLYEKKVFYHKKMEMPTLPPNILPDVVNAGTSIANLQADFPISIGYTLGLIILASAHTIVSLGMLIHSSRTIKTPFVLVSRLFWIISLAVCILLLVFASIEYSTITKVNNDWQNVKDVINNIPSML